MRLSGNLADFVQSHTGEDGSYEDAGEYLRDLVRRDRERCGQEAFGRLKAELAAAFAAPDESYQPLTADEVIAGGCGLTSTRRIRAPST